MSSLELLGFIGIFDLKDYCVYFICFCSCIGFCVFCVGIWFWYFFFVWLFVGVFVDCWDYCCDCGLLVLLGLCWELCGLLGLVVLLGLCGLLG